MKRIELIKRFRRAGWILLRNGSEHDIYISPTGYKFSIPRHKEISDGVTKQALKILQSK